MLKTENKMSEIQNSLARLNRKLDIAMKKINELEDRSIGQ